MSNLRPAAGVVRRVIPVVFVNCDVSVEVRGVELNDALITDIE